MSPKNYFAGIFLTVTIWTGWNRLDDHEGCLFLFTGSIIEQQFQAQFEEDQKSFIVKERESLSVQEDEGTLPSKPYWKEFFVGIFFSVG